MDAVKLIACVPGEYEFHMPEVVGVLAERGDRECLKAFAPVCCDRPLMIPVLAEALSRVYPDHAAHGLRLTSRLNPNVDPLARVLAICYLFAMGAIHIRDVDDAVLARLKERAQAHNRSLQGEMREILREAAFGSSIPPSAPTRRILRLTTVEVGARTDYGRADIYDDDGR